MSDYAFTNKPLDAITNIAWRQ